ncbi:SDR family NAD(P)-dependent oxidoreductase [Vibrio hyugaensis]|uniref:SDR family NAD(P)-dependent oxidoreductase n=1 Tax=Vibrio hyugaensis TaxID=1534743 RepID=UPI000CE2C82D|nr:SDR family NAD(P)-dependent oxidoreductase [Vibrio hyugaensis]
MSKFALITGGSRGIGKAISHYFAQRGYSLLLLSLNRENLERTKEELTSKFTSCHVETICVDLNCLVEVETVMTSIIQKKGTIDALVNSAGILVAGNTGLRCKKVSEVVNINLTSTITICNLVAEKMKDQSFGEIYNLGSTAGFNSVPKIAVYSAIKAAVFSYSQSLYYELLPFGVKVCCLCPSVVDTDMTNDGRIDNKLKINAEDLTKALEFIQSLSPGAAVSSLTIRCRVIDLENGPS